MSLGYCVGGVSLQSNLFAVVKVCKLFEYEKGYRLGLFLLKSIQHGKVWFMEGKIIGTDTIARGG